MLGTIVFVAGLGRPPPSLCGHSVRTALGLSCTGVDPHLAIVHLGCPNTKAILHRSIIFSIRIALLFS